MQLECFEFSKTNLQNSIGRKVHQTIHKTKRKNPRATMQNMLIGDRRLENRKFEVKIGVFRPKKLIFFVFTLVGELKWRLECISHTF